MNFYFYSFLFLCLSKYIYYLNVVSLEQLTNNFSLFKNSIEVNKSAEKEEEEEEEMY